MALASLIAACSLLVIAGLPVRMLLRPFGWLFRIMPLGGKGVATPRH
jgi:hypothetical protein